MGKVRIKGVQLENYKCHERLETDLFDRTSISGKNRTGKTTVMDAAFDVLTGKMTDGTTPDNIRPHDENGNEIQKVDIIRQLNLDVDGKEMVIRKITKQKWIRKHGSGEEIFDGNETTYEVDGFPYKSKAYADFIEDAIAKPETIQFCSNANMFLSVLRKSTSEARKLLEKISGFNSDDFAATNEEYSAAREIIKDKPVEDVIKKLKKDLTAENKKIDEKNTEIKYEQNRVVKSDGPELADLELLLKELKRQLEELDQEEDPVSETYKKASEELVKLNEQLREICKSAEDNFNIARQKAKKDVMDTRHSVEVVEKKLEFIKNNLVDLERQYENYKTQLKETAEEWTEESKREFDDSELIEAQALVFDENTLICPTCGQKLPDDQGKRQIAAFEEMRAKQIKSCMSKRERFYKKKQKTLDEIKERGQAAKEKVDFYKYEIDKSNSQIRQMEFRRDKRIQNLSICEKVLSELPAEVDLSGNASVSSLKAEIAEKEERISKLDSGEEKRQERLHRRSELMDRISDTDAQIRKKLADESDQGTRLTMLNTELRQISQRAADIEQMIDIVQEYSMEKNKALSEEINRHFQHLQFKFLDYTQEGNPYETCRIMVSGTDYMNGLNGGDKRLAEIDLCRGFQEMNDLCLPIWVDEANTIDPWRIPNDLEQQLILLRRTDNNTIKIEETE